MVLWPGLGRVHLSPVSAPRLLEEIEMKIILSNVGGSASLARGLRLLWPRHTTSTALSSGCWQKEKEIIGLPWLSLSPRRGLSSLPAAPPPYYLLRKSSNMIKYNLINKTPGRPPRRMFVFGLFVDKIESFYLCICWLPGRRQVQTCQPYKSHKSQHNRSS